LPAGWSAATSINVGAGRDGCHGRTKESRPDGAAARAALRPGLIPEKSVIKNNVPVSIRRPIYNPLKNQSGSPPGFSREKDVRF
jgi:hypothetical protein